MSTWRSSILMRWTYLSEDPSWPVETLPNPILSSTAFSTCILEDLYHTPDVEEPVRSPTFQPRNQLHVFSTSLPPEKYHLFPGKYKHQSTDHLPVRPLNINDRWGPVTGHHFACEQCNELPKYTNPTYVPSEYSQFSEEDYDDMIEYTPIIEQEDIFQIVVMMMHTSTSLNYLLVSLPPIVTLWTPVPLVTSSMTNRGMMLRIHWPCINNIFSRYYVMASMPILL